MLSEWQTFSSAAGVGLANFNKETPWRPPSIVLEADPPLHTRTRTVLARTMTPGIVRQLRERFEREAEALVDRILDMGEFDGIADFGEQYPTKVFPDAVGLPEQGRENLLPYGSMVFNSFGPRNALTEAAFVNADAVRGWIMANCTRAALTSDGLGAMIYAGVDTGELTEDEAAMLVRSFLSAGVDTTVNAFGNLLWCLATWPDQWGKLRDNPGLARNAFEEGLRYEGPAQCFFRTTTKDVEIGGVPIAADEKIVAFMGSANRDPRRWENPDVIRHRAQGRRPSRLRHGHSRLRRPADRASRRRGGVRRLRAQGEDDRTRRPSRRGSTTTCCAHLRRCRCASRRTEDKRAVDEGDTETRTHDPRSAPDAGVARDVRTSPKALDLDNYAVAYLTWIANKMSSSASALYRKRFGVGITDWRIMALLAVKSWIPAGRISEVIGFDKAVISRSVAFMQERGLVETRFQRQQPASAVHRPDQGGPRAARPDRRGRARTRRIPAGRPERAGATHRDPAARENPRARRATRKGRRDMRAVRQWSVRHAAGLERLYAAFARLAPLLGPVATFIGTKTHGAPSAARRAARERA